MFGGTELDKGIVALHVNADEFSVGRKEHFEVFTLGRLFVEVDNEEGFGGGNLFASFVFLAFDAAITTGKFGTKGFGDHVDIPVGDRVFVWRERGFGGWKGREKMMDEYGW